MEDKLFIDINDLASKAKAKAHYTVDLGIIKVDT